MTVSTQITRNNNKKDSILKTMGDMNGPNPNLEKLLEKFGRNEHQSSIVCAVY